jgi:hypothetical protein
MGDGDWVIAPGSYTSRSTPSAAGATRVAHLFLDPGERVGRQQRVRIDEHDGVSLASARIFGVSG